MKSTPFIGTLPIHLMRSSYDPYFLDDPELRAGRHCTVVALVGYYSSLTHYVPQSVLEHELNRHFLSKHGKHLEPSITLTKIRSIKSQLIQVALECRLELGSVALAFVYFEKLILARIVNKSNRKVIAAACLLLAVKAHDLKSIDFAQLVRSMSRLLNILPGSVTRSEFPVFASLHFELHLSQDDYVPHLERILIDLPYSNLQEYLGERMFNLWKQKGSPR
jgi:hypothetical protein